MTTIKVIEGWAVRRSNGSVLVDVAPDATEASCWNVAFGWPSADEIEQEKAKGAVAYRCSVSPL